MMQLMLLIMVLHHCCSWCKLLGLWLILQHCWYIVLTTVAIAVVTQAIGDILDVISTQPILF